jgi:toxin ParE1/3/4
LPNTQLIVADLDISPAARADLVDIRRFSLDQFGPEVADSYFMGFDDAFSLLAEHPMAGPSRPEFGLDIRCLVHRSHRIIYKIDSDVVVIIRILHHSRDAKRALQ